MKALAFFIAALSVACSSGAGSTAGAGDGTAPSTTAREAPAVEVGDKARVYRGREALEVTVVPVRGHDGKQALVVVSGVQSEIADVVFLCTIERRGRSGDSYRTTLPANRSRRSGTL